MIRYEHGYYWVDDGGTINDLLDRLRSKWIREVGTIEGLTTEDIKSLDDESLTHGCYTCIWSERGTCMCSENKIYMIPEECPLMEHIDIDLEEVFNFDPRLFC